MKDSFVSHLLIFFSLSLGLLFGSNALPEVFQSSSGFYLEETLISSPVSRLAENHCWEKAALEKEEKEEKESETDSDGPDAWYGTQVGDLVPSTLGLSLHLASNLFEPYSKRKLYIIFHCLKSDLA